MKPHPLIAVRNVEVSGRWYQALLGCRSGHGGSEYERLLYENNLVLQLHRWDAHEHPHLGKPEALRGNGVLLWFETAEFDEAVGRARALKAEVLEGPKVNHSAQHREIWLRDPDGYVVVLASAYGDLGPGESK